MASTDKVAENVAVGSTVPSNNSGQLSLALDRTASDMSSPVNSNVSSPVLNAGALDALDRNPPTRHVREIGIFSAQRSFQELVSCLDQNYVGDFIHWINEEFGPQRTALMNYTMDGQADSLTGVSSGAADTKLLQIAAELRAELPVDAMAPKEHIIFPANGGNSDCSEETTLHVDSFLFPDDEVDHMCETGRLARHFCSQCKSRKIEPIIYVSHSASIIQLRHVFGNLLPPLTGKTLVDIGSRLGNVLYAGHLMSDAEQLIGVEIDEYFSKLSRKTLVKHGMTDRCKVIHADVLEQAELLGRADVIVLNNVFEFFLPADKQIEMWHFLHRSIRRSGCYVVTVPSLAKTLRTLGIKDISLSEWVTPADAYGAESVIDSQPLDNDDDEEHELGAFHIYQTL